MSYKSINILYNVFYAAISAKILQICKTTTKFQDFIKSSEKKNHKQEGLLDHMKRALLKLFSSHKQCFIIFRKTNYY